MCDSPLLFMSQLQQLMLCLLCDCACCRRPGRWNSCALQSSYPDGSEWRNHSHSNHLGDTWRTTARAKPGNVNLVLSEPLSQLNKDPNYLVNEKVCLLSLPLYRMKAIKLKGSAVLIIELHQTQAMPFDGPSTFSTLFNDSCLYSDACNLIWIQAQSICIHH